MFLYSFSITIIVFTIQSLTKASEHEIENYRVGKQLNDLTQEDQALIDGKFKSSLIFPTIRIVLSSVIISSYQEWTTDSTTFQRCAIQFFNQNQRRRCGWSRATFDYKQQNLSQQNQKWILHWSRSIWWRNSIQFIILRTQERLERTFGWTKPRCICRFETKGNFTKNFKISFPFQSGF